MVDRLIRITTALAVVAVAAVAAVISYRHAYELVTANGESGFTARLVPLTVDGLIWAASMVILDASRRGQRAPALAKWSLGAGIVATIGANVAHGLNHGPIGPLVSAWPALALVGSFELLMTLTCTAVRPTSEPPGPTDSTTSVHDEPPRTKPAQTPEEAVLADYRASLNGPGRPLSRRYLAEKHNMDRRKIKQIIAAATQP